jgi:glutamyl-tRNA reductase
MDTTFSEVYYDVERSIDYAFRGKFVLKFYDYLKVRKSTGVQVEEFLKSKIVDEIRDIVNELEDYIIGGSDEIHKQLREAYGYISKPQARKIKTYLNNILEDACKYANEKKRRGRKIKTK